MAHKIPILRRPSGNYEAVRDRFSPQAHTDRVLRRLARMEIPGKEHLENYTLSNPSVFQVQRFRTLAFFALQR